MKLTEKHKNCLYCSPDLKGVVPIVEDGGETVLSMVEVDGTPAIELKVGYVDKYNSKMFANLIELCGSYLPNDGKEA